MPHINLAIMVNGSRYTGITISSSTIKSSISTILSKNDINIDPDWEYLVNNKPLDILRTFDDLKISSSCLVKIIAPEITKMAAHDATSMIVTAKDSEITSEQFEEDLTPTMSELQNYYFQTQKRRDAEGHLYSKLLKDQAIDDLKKSMPLLKLRIMLPDDRIASTEISNEKDTRSIYRYCESIWSGPFVLMHTIPGGGEFPCDDQIINSLGFIHSLTLRLIEQ